MKKGELQMIISRNVFRGYDIRGIYPTEINAEAAEKIGKGFATLMKRQGQTKIIVGHDIRLSGEDLFQALAEVITSIVFDVINIGLCATPTSYFAREYLGVKPSIMITASHNPKEYNGFKICGLGKDTIYGEEIQDLRKFIEEGKFDIAEIPGKVEFVDLTKAYIDYTVNKVKLGDRKLKIAVDCGSGSASLYAKEAYERMGAEVLMVADTPNGNFPIHHPDPTQEKNMLEFEKFVVENHCDMGIAFDGDADRVIVIDETGDLYFGDEYMIIVWRDLMPKYPGSVAILDVKCTQALYEEIEKLGGKPEFCKVGSSLIKAELRKRNLIFAGEYAGHIYFNDDHYGYDDALYAGARMMQILSNTNKKLSELMEGVTKYEGSPEVIYQVTDDTKLKIVEEVKNRFLKEGYKVIDIDGARILFEDGWGLIRASNTGPNLTIKSEAHTKEGWEKILNTIKSYIEECKGDH